MRTILVPTNFSASSVNAAKYAADMAAAIHADLMLLYVMELPASNAEVSMSKQVLNEMQQEAADKLSNLKADLEKQTNGKINIAFIQEIGTVEKQIETFCKIKAPFAVVMAIKKNPAERLVFGSNTLFAIKHLHYPLLVIPEDASFHAINRIALAYDLSGLNRNIPVEYLKQLKTVFQAEFDVININAEKNSDESKWSDELLFIKTLLHDLYPKYHSIIAPSAEQGIGKFLETNHPDLLLLLPKKHSFFEFHKSLTKQMILDVKMPVMAIHE